MITNREIQSETLLEEALDEVAASALANGIAAADLAARLREYADRVEDGEFDASLAEDGGAEQHEE